MDPKNTSIWIIVGAVIVGGSILAGSFILNGSLRETSDKLQGIQTSLTETKEELKTLAANRPASGAARRGPEPNRRYNINTKGAPTKGPRTAQIEIVEFSDFQ